VDAREKRGRRYCCPRTCSRDVEDAVTGLRFLHRPHPRSVLSTICSRAFEIPAERSGAAAGDDEETLAQLRDLIGRSRRWIIAAATFEHSFLRGRGKGRASVTEHQGSTSAGMAQTSPHRAGFRNDGR